MGVMTGQSDSGDGAIVEFSGGGYLKISMFIKAFCVVFVV